MPVKYVVSYLSFFYNVLEIKKLEYEAEVPWKTLAIDSFFKGDEEAIDWLSYFPDEWDAKVCGQEFFNGECQFTWIKL